MNTVEIAPSIKIKTLLYLTDFSAPSENALPIALAVAFKYGASIKALHILTPVIPEACHDAVHADEALAKGEMMRVQSLAAGVAIEPIMSRGVTVWDAVDRLLRENDIDLIVLGTRGRTGVPKLLLGSVAEEIFRRAPIPVLTVGPHVSSSISGCRFQRVLFATDFSSESEAAAPYALSLAQENHASLALLHVMKEKETGNPAESKEYEKVVERLRQICPPDAEQSVAPEIAVEHGEPAERILAAASQLGADLIVLGVRGAAGHLDAATHLERAVAHRVVAHAPCPVLTVRARETAASS